MLTLFAIRHLNTYLKFNSIVVISINIYMHINIYTFVFSYVTKIIINLNLVLI